MDRNLFDAVRIPETTSDAWRAVSKAEEGREGFVDPVSAAEVEELTDEERLHTTWTNLTFEQVRDAVSDDLRAREAGAALVQRDEVESLSSQHWELFYSRNASKFFKDRHYLERDYPELFAHMPPNASMLECGCGAGNTVWPLLEKHPLWTARAFDCSATAVRIVQERRHPQVAACFVWDPCAQPETPLLEPASLDLVTMIFFLSALPTVAGIEAVFAQCARALRPGGCLLVRDYGAYDMTQLRFAAKKGRRVAPNVYCRADGTLARFFEAPEVDGYAAACGLLPLTSGYECRELRNRKRLIKMHRVWVSCVYRKPPAP